MFQSSNFAIELPDLYVVAIDKPLSGDNSGVILVTNDQFRTLLI